MAKSMNLAILLLALAAMLHTTLAVDYTVGGSTGWRPNGASFYTDWAANYTFKLNDVLVFNFAKSVHDVVVLNKANFDNCSFGENLGNFTSPPVRITLNRTGEFYFACSYPDHCALGQKLAVNVSASSPSAPAPAPVPSSSSSPTSPGPSANSPPGSGTTAPPPPNAATPSSPTSPGPSANSPPGSGTTAPPPPNAATPLAATFSLLLITIATAFFFQF